MLMARRWSFVILSLVLVLTQSCSSSSDPAPGGGDSGPTGGGNGGNNPGGGTAPPGGEAGAPADPGATDASLAHEATPLPKGPDASPTDPFVSQVGREQAAALPGALGVIVEAVENQGPDANLDCAALGAQYNSCSVINLHIKDADGVLAQPGWELAFHSIRRILRVDSDAVDVARINGDLNVLRPTASFDASAGPVYSVKLVTEFAHLVKTDFMPRYWLTAADGTVQLIPNSNDPDEPLAYAAPITGGNASAFDGEPQAVADSANRFARYAPVTAAAAQLDANTIQARIIPQPQSIGVGAGTLDISGGITIDATVLPADALAALAAQRARINADGAANQATTSIDTSLPPGGYRLVVEASGIRISGHDEQAIFHGAQSLHGLIQPGVATLPFVDVNDSPRYGFRGMHLDIARNFQGPETLQRVIDQMSVYKLNRLHLHLADDEGWRLQIPSLPELTSVGAVRLLQPTDDGRYTEATGLLPQLGSGPAADTSGSGFLTRQEFVDLLTYARARYITIIPEFDMPAHARAAVVSMRARASRLGTPDDTAVRLDDPADTSNYLTVQHFDDGILNPCLPGTYNFIEAVVGDVKAMYSAARVELPIWHMGGDEAINIYRSGGIPDADPEVYHLPWERSPACEAFIASQASVGSRDDLQRYFVQRVSGIVNEAGIPALYAFQDILDGLSSADLATPRAGVSYWRSVSAGGVADAYTTANAGFETVIAVPDFLYFDFAQELDPNERGFYWGSRMTDTAKVFSFAPDNLAQNAQTSVNQQGAGWEASSPSAGSAFFGLQGQLWGETVRLPEHVDYMMFPRLLALAERAWHKASWELPVSAGQSFSQNTTLVDEAVLSADYAGFARAVAIKELPKLDAAGVAYRIPVPGARLANGALEMNTAFPGLPLQYSLDGSNWEPWAPGAAPGSVLAVRGVSADGTRAGRATAVVGN